MKKLPVIPYLPEELEAIRRFQNGEQPCFSTGICESITYGYGKLSHNGYWQYPLPYEYLTNLQKELVDSYNVQ